MVLPVHNAETTIEETLKSILKQSFEDFELVVVDDGSCDKSASIIRQIAANDCRIRHFHLRHGGIARALNFGIKISSGQYIARMDADDIAHPDRLKLQSEYLDKHPQTGLVASLVNYTGNAEANAGYAGYVEWINSISKHCDIPVKRFVESPFAHPSVMFRSILSRMFGGYHEGPVPEDYELWLRWMHHGVEMAKVPRYLLDWYDHTERLSRTHDHYSYQNFYRVKAKYLRLFLKRKFQEQLPEIWVWGAGRQVNNRVAPIVERGLHISKYIDVKRRSDNSGRFIHYSDIPEAGQVFILSYVTDRKGKKDIIQYLESKGYREGDDFLMMA